MLAGAPTLPLHTLFTSIKDWYRNPMTNWLTANFSINHNLHIPPACEPSLPFFDFFFVAYTSPIKILNFVVYSAKGLNHIIHIFLIFKSILKRHKIVFLPSSLTSEVFPIIIDTNVEWGLGVMDSPLANLWDLEISEDK